MIEFRLNLVRDRVPSRRRRRVRYWAMIAYLAVVGVALTVSLSFGTSQALRAAVVRKDVARLQQRFAQTHATEGGMAAYTAWASRVLANRIEVLKAVDHRLASGTQPAALTTALVLSLPEGVRLRSLSIDAGEQTVAFELVVSAERAEATSGPSDIMAQWQRSAILNAHLAGILYLGSQRHLNGDDQNVVWRFSGRLVRKES